MPDGPPTARPAEDVVPFGAAVRAWFAISLQTFGGPAGQIAVMQRELVERRRWIGQRRFLHALSFCTLLPGPEAQQLSIYIGWLLNGVRGGLVAGVLFVLPGVVALLGLSVLYVAHGDTEAVRGLFAGLAPAVLAVVAYAVVRLGRSALRHPALVALAAAAFLALTVFGVAFPVVVAVAAVVGWGLGRWVPDTIASPADASPTAGASDAGDAAGAAPLVPDDALYSEQPSRRHSLVVLAVGLVAWGVPVGLVLALTGAGSAFTEQSLFFSGAALVTFGGAYAVLAYVAQQAVEVYGWLGPGEMVRGLALAESTPGPLIMVVQFVAFVGAYRDPGPLDPWAAAVLAALLTTWVTFVPCFVLIFLGAPYVERLRGNRALTAALTGILAAVVGVIANLAVYFALHTLFGETVVAGLGPAAVELPVLSSVDWFAAALTGLAGVLLARGGSVLRVLGVCAALGLGQSVVGSML